MSDGLLFFGDSNVHYFTFIDKEIDKNTVTDDNNEFHENLSIYNNEIEFIWKHGASSQKFNKQYILDKIYEYELNNNKIKHIFFQLGYIDLRFKIKSLDEIDGIVKNYIYNAVEFAKENDFIPHFITPVAPPAYIDRAHLYHFIELMNKYCETLDANLVDIYDVVPDNYTSEQWDENLHLDRYWSSVAIRYILGSIL